jgi:hypothetical protein
MSLSAESSKSYRQDSVLWVFPRFFALEVFHSECTLRSHILHMAWERACKAVEFSNLAMLRINSRKKIGVWKTILLGYVAQKHKIAPRSKILAKAHT